VFCGQAEIVDHLFVQCSLAQILWQWIASHSTFNFSRQSLNDLWIIDYTIPLKNKKIIELISDEYNRG
jgi:hypothetical protein